MLSYAAILERDRDGSILVEFPDFPEAHTWGADRDEAVVRARDALATVIDAYIQERRQIPAPSNYLGGVEWIKVPTLTEAKIQLYRAMRDKHVNKSELGKRLGWHPPQVDRVLNVYHLSRLDQLERAFEALGKEMSIAVRDTGVERGRASRPGTATGGGSGGRGRRVSRDGEPPRPMKTASLSRPRRKRRRTAKRHA